MPFLTGLIRAGIRTMSSNTYIAGTHSMAFVTVPNVDVARKLAHGIIQNRLAACVNIIPGLTSVYEWKGKVEEDSELLLMIKTATDKVADLSKFVRENHPYECAEVISSKIDDGNPPYLKWIGDTVSKPVQK
ncbi:hypothetical protein CHS0354_037644 [Potamilus streckersoni]|uniref:Protein CutA homolog n=1 Tax=Potamilus streckersoni TaxID=2493646 RepID=A0AAE0T7M4_9BIVA|nr:hypothetical protein CHS0354_037644 [Potamilus streckersoni]